MTTSKQPTNEARLRALREIIDQPGFDLEAVRSDFAYLKDPEGAVIYLDNAATTQRPEAVIDRMAHFYRYENANPLRGNHRLSLYATQAYEQGRAHVQRFLHAAHREEILFTRNTTESLNLLSYVFALHVLQPGDEILITRMEHHSNSVNWQFACQRSGAKLVYVDLNEDYALDLDDYKEKLTDRTRLVAFTAASNVLGAENPVKEMVGLAHAKGAIAIIDAAQYAPHGLMDVQDWDADFVAFSGHKMLAPFGIGVLYGKKDQLEKLSPFLYGGEMIEYVYDQTSTFAPLPYKFEAGTQDVGGVVGLDAALTYLEGIGMDQIARYEKALAEYCAIKLQAREDIALYHPHHSPRGTAVAFNIKGVHPHDVSTIMDSRGIAIRSGHHCAQQLHRALGITASCRASFAFYNSLEEVDRFLEALDAVVEIMNPQEV